MGVPVFRFLSPLRVRDSVWPEKEDYNSPELSLTQLPEGNSRGQMRQTEPRARKSGILRGRPSAGTIDMLRRMIIRPYGSVNVSSFPLINLFSPPHNFSRYIQKIRTFADLF